MIVVLRIVDSRGHRKDQKVLIIDRWIIDFEPELDAVGGRPLCHGWRWEADEARILIELSRHMPVVASDAIEDLSLIINSTIQITTLKWNLKENVLKVILTGNLEDFALGP